MIHDMITIMIHHIYSALFQRRFTIAAHSYSSSENRWKARVKRCVVRAVLNDERVRAFQREGAALSPLDQRWVLMGGGDGPQRTWDHGRGCGGGEVRGRGQVVEGLEGEELYIMYIFSNFEVNPVLDLRSSDGGEGAESLYPLWSTVWICKGLKSTMLKKRIQFFSIPCALRSLVSRFFQCFVSGWSCAAAIIDLSWGFS